MKRRLFTLIELLVVIVIIGILITLVAGGYSNFTSTAHALESQKNLRDIGTAIIAFSNSDDGKGGYFPVKEHRLKATDGSIDPAWIASVKKDAERKPEECMQTLRESKAGSNLDIKSFLSPIAPCSVPALTGDTYGPLTADNVGFLMVKGPAKLSRYKNKAIMRDVDDGHENGAYGYILKSTGASEKVSAVGPEGAYTKKWFENKSKILNFDKFKGDGGAGNE